MKVTMTSNKNWFSLINPHILSHITRTSSKNKLKENNVFTDVCTYLAWTCSFHTVPH
ncbi:unnamed protein product [Nezara viridula]|uniref:Uncharacterized protein n=1 Tax=Nezara viridula TaxID=85310 RepID=A0A9P0E8N7_NEZVI|nr:unnamed protein product [Nezara viridula]